MFGTHLAFSVLYGLHEPQGTSSAIILIPPDILPCHAEAPFHSQLRRITIPYNSCGGCVVRVAPHAACAAVAGSCGTATQG